jgi:hypothetical protein
MADLSQKATDGRLSFVKYVTENKRLDEIDFEIEKGKPSPLYTKKGTALSPSTKIYKEGTQFKITDKQMFEIGGMKLAKVKVGTVAGYFPINRIRKPTGGNGTQYEDEIVDAVNQFIKDAGGSINIKIKGDSTTYKDILYAVKVDTPIKQKAGVRGDPKADIILCKDIKNPTAPGSIYISHKKEGGPEAFQQYGGLSEQAGSEIYNHPLTQKFLQEVGSAIGRKTQLPYPIMATFTDKKLANMSIYGPEYGKAFSLQHTQLIGQGKVAFNKQRSGNLYEMNFTSHMSLSGDLSHFTGGYLPVFGATFRAGRGFDFGGKRYNGARVAIYPYKLMATRSGLVTFEF